MTLHQYSGLSLEASYRFDERLATLGVYTEPTVAQYRIAWDEAFEFDRETVRRKLGKDLKNAIDNQGGSGSF